MSNNTLTPEELHEKILSLDGQALFEESIKVINECFAQQRAAGKVEAEESKWISVKDVLPQTGINVRCKLPDIGLGKKEKTLYRMKHNGKWNDYNDLVI